MKLTQLCVSVIACDPETIEHTQHCVSVMMCGSSAVLFKKHTQHCISVTVCVPAGIRMKRTPFETIASWRTAETV